jgi:hypothetical protein
MRLTIKVYEERLKAPTNMSGRPGGKQLRPQLCRYVCESLEDLLEPVTELEQG